MRSEFELTFEEFSEELDALLEMAVPKRGHASLSPKARIAAGNAATLLLAATFEEFIRQQVKIAFTIKARKLKNIAEFPPKIAANVWKRALGLLSRTPFDEIESNSKAITAKVSSIVSFSLDKNHVADVSEALSHNENNMRPDQLNSLFSAIGISSVCMGACREKIVIDHLGSQSAENCHDEFKIRLEDFFRRRNATAHAIRSTVSSGPIDLQRDVDLLRVFGRALTKIVEAEITSGGKPKSKPRVKSVSP